MDGTPAVRRLPRDKAEGLLRLGPDPQPALPILVRDSAWPTAATGIERGMKHYTIVTVAEKSPDFRRVLWTGKHIQLVVMTIPPGGEIGDEVHEDTDQILTFVSGVGEARVAGEKRDIARSSQVVVPAGTRHNIVNTGPNPLVLYTVYGPPEHADQAVHRTKEEADAAEAAGADHPPTS